MCYYKYLLILLFAFMIIQNNIGADTGEKESTNTVFPVKLPYEKILPGAISDVEIMTPSSFWSGEYIMQIHQLDENGFLLEQKRGRSCKEIKPWLLARNKISGEGIGIFLAYPGNWRIELQASGDNTVLRADTIPGELPVYDEFAGLPVPGALVTLFHGSWDNGANAIKSFIREHLLRDLGSNWPWVQYNTWFDQSEKLEVTRLLQTAQVAADLGCELFVIDAGWYGTDSNWNYALGDWHINRDRFPDDLTPIIDKVRSLGMKFGLWVEIEFAHPESPVVKENPDWLLPVSTRPDRVCLDFGNAEALEWATQEIDRLVTSYNLDYIKMDFNTNLDDIEGSENTGMVIWNHYKGLASLWQNMRQKYPNLIMENCASGSLRADLTSAIYTDTHWVSDNVDNWANLVMNVGASYMFPPEMNNHWTCTPEDSEFLDVQACFRVNMFGQFGLSGPVVEWNDDALNHARKEIALYKELRPLIRSAEVFHLTDQAELNSPGMTQILQYTKQDHDQSVIFVFAGGEKAQIEIKPVGLNKTESYRVSSVDEFIQDQVISGEELMQGLTIELPEKNMSTILNLEPVS